MLKNTPKRVENAWKRKPPNGCSLKKVKIENEGEKERDCHSKETLQKCGHITIGTYNYKSPIYHSELQQCHYRFKMVDKWRGQADWHGAHMAMIWKLSLHLKIIVQAQKFAPQNT